MEQMATPADVVFALIGPPEVVGPLCNLSRTVPYTWKRPAGDRREAGDIPSPITMRKLLRHAAAHNIPLEPRHLIFGCERSELDALVKTLPQRPEAPARVAAE